VVRKDSQIERLGTVLEQSLKRFDLSSRLNEYSVWPIWNDVVGPTVARNAQPEKIRNGTLFVKVTSTVWMQQLQYMKDVILEKLNQRLGTEVVKKIFFVAGRLDADIETQREPLPAATKAATQEANLDKQFLDAVRDPEIRKAFQRLFNIYSRRGKKK
jgi:predicted nucleic acid-binding Zn ribbon protein